MLIVTQVAPYADGPAGVHGVLGQAATGLARAGRPGRAHPGRGERRPRDVSPDDLAAARVLALFTIGETPWSAAQKEADPRRPGGSAGLRILGVHSATDANHTWPEYGSMLGARFDGHPWTQDFAIDVVDAEHPATAHLGHPLALARRGLPVRRPASRRPGPAPPGRRTRSTCRRPGGRVPDCGFPLAWSVAGRARPAPSTARWATSRGPGRRPAYLRHLAGGLAWLVETA